MTFYLRKGNSFQVSESGKLDVYETLPVGTYVIEQDIHGNYFLDKIADFEAPKRVYGSTMRHTDRIMRTYQDRTVSTGVMLAGEKGSGKSLLAKMLSVAAAKLEYPTIVINRPWHGDSFNKLIQEINQPCLILFDEFEKVYDENQQENILTLFDGMFPTKKLFVLTCNDKWRIDQNMRNRPGRIFYMLDFVGLEHDFIQEYCEENLLNKAHIDGVTKIASLFSQFNFDMLKAMVEEMNRYGETAQEVMQMLNTKPEYSDKVDYDVQMVVDGVPVDEEDQGDKTWRGNPLIHKLEIGYNVDLPPDEDGEVDNEWRYMKMTPSDIKTADGKSGRFVFIRGNHSMVLTKRKEETFNYAF